MAESHAGSTGQPRIGPDADSDKDQISRNPAAIITDNGLFLNARSCAASQDGHPLFDEILLEARCQIRIEKRTNLRQLFDQRDLHTGTSKVFHHLKANKTAADHHGCSRVVLFDIGAYGDGVVRISQRENMLAIHAGKLRPDRRSACRQDQRVIMIGENPFAVQITHNQAFGRRVDAHDLMADQNINVVLAFKECRIPGCQFLDPGDRSANEIGQAASGIRDESIPLIKDYFGLLIVAPCLSRG